MFVVGSTLSMTIWYRLIVRDRWGCCGAYVVATVLTLHAHYLAALMILAQVAWWLSVWIKRPADQRSRKPVIALLLVGVLCAPVLLRWACWASPVSRTFQWIEQPTLHGAWTVLQRLTFGWPWVILLLLPATILWLTAALRSRAPVVPATLRRDHEGTARTCGDGRWFTGREDPCGLLLLWLMCAWSGLLVISWLGQPAMITRYALPAAVPAMLLPLVVCHRLDPRVPPLVALLFLLGTAPQWAAHGLDVDQGFRELSRYVRQHVDPETEAVVLTLDDATSADWKDVERLALAYYPLADRPIYELPVTRARPPSEPSILQDPRTLYLIVFRAEPFQLIEQAGREVTPIKYDGTSYSRLLFAPYRLIRVAPLTP
jgi:hypothetical protein